MQIPSIGHRQFCVLGGLLAGPLTLHELADRLGRPKCQVHVGAIHRSGLIEKWDELLDTEKKRRVYAITDEGRRAWQESADFYLNLIERFGNADAAEQPDVLSRKQVKPEKPRKPPEPRRCIRHYPVTYTRLRCPQCHSAETEVSSTRKPIRYHRCLLCGQRFKSIEA